MCNRLIILPGAMAIALLCLPIPGPAQTLRIAISPFLDRSGDTESATGSSQRGPGMQATGSTTATKGDLGGQIADALITELVRLGRYDIVERLEIEKVISEKKLNLSDLGDAVKASEAARIVGANMMITGSVTEAATSESGSGFVVFKKRRLTGRVVIDARLIDIRSNRAVWASKSEGVEEIESKDILSIGGSRVAGVSHLLGKAARKAAEKLVEDLTPKLDAFSGISVTDATRTLEADATVRSGKIYIAAGAKRRAVVGDAFELIALGEPVRIGTQTIREETVVATVQVDAVMADHSTAPLPAALTTNRAEIVKARRVRKAADELASSQRAPVPAVAGSAPPDPVKAVADESTINPQVGIVYGKRDGINLRKGPGTTFEIAGKLSRGAPLQILEIDGAWIRVRTQEGVEGWISAALTGSKP